MVGSEKKPKKILTAKAARAALAIPTVEGVEVVWKCWCMRKEEIVVVPFRRPDEDTVAWMANCVQNSLYIAHRFMRPDCYSTNLEYAKLPMDENAPGLGMRRILNS